MAVWAVCLLPFFAVTAATGDSDISGLKIDAPGCGQRNPPYTEPVISTFIVNGNEAPPFVYPFVCNLFYGQTELCGGALITNKTGDYWFITAAHCLTAGVRATYTIRCGIHNVGAPRQPFEFRPAPLTPVAHEEFDNATYKDYDIALFPLEQAGFPSERIGPVCITTENPQPGENATVLAWGSTGTVTGYSPTLQIGFVLVQPENQCQQVYGDLFNTNSMLCADGRQEGSADACKGDSGGPLVVTRNGEMQLIGLVSFGYGCGRPSSPEIYTDVMKLKPWINSKINTGRETVIG